MGNDDFICCWIISNIPVLDRIPVTAGSNRYKSRICIAVCYDK